YNKLSGYRYDPGAPGFLLDDDLNEKWKTAGNRTKNQTLFDKWLHGLDIKNAKLMIQAMENLKRQREEKKKERKNKLNINIYSALMDENEHDELEEDDHLSDDNQFDPIQQRFLLDWQEPKTDRSLELLRNDSNIWKMSKA